MASNVSATAMMRAMSGISVPRSPCGYPRPSSHSWCNSMPGTISWGWVTRRDGGGNHPDRIEEELPVLFRRILELLHIEFQVGAHVVEGGGEFADFRAALE